LTLLAVAACADGRPLDSETTPPQQAGAMSDSAFAALVAHLSEPGGYFDTDNLISNETSYLHPIDRLKEQGMIGGAYVGVGPDQNFSYIAAIRPEIAFIIDIRRDNLLQQLLSKSLFQLAEGRIEYLCLLFARPLPENVEEWRLRGIEELTAYIDETPTDPDLVEITLARVVSTAAGFGVALTDDDVATIRRFHSEFIGEGLDLRFRSHGRMPRPQYPTYRRLLLERDRNGRRAGYLANEADFQYLRSMQTANLIVPVVGDLAGDHALAAIGAEIQRRGLQLTALYTSNVEYYLVQDRTFHKYAMTVRSLPYDSSSVIIRSYFGRNFGDLHPQAVPGHYSVQLLQRIVDFVDDYGAGRYRDYRDLVSPDALLPG
jgi:hypothetical protein